MYISLFEKIDINELKEKNKFIQRQIKNIKDKSNKAIKNQQEIIDAAKEEITKIKKQNQPVIDKLRKDIDRNNLIISNLNETD